jgi:CDGSH-type Zn-finger protein
MDISLGGERMADARLQILNQGPIIVAGHVDLVDDNGNTIRRQEPVALCRCGQSESMPFCDGIDYSHMKSCSRAKDIL